MYLLFLQVLHANTMASVSTLPVVSHVTARKASLVQDAKQTSTNANRILVIMMAHVWTILERSDVSACLVS